MSQKPIKPKVARAAANWWAQQLRDEDPLVDNGDLEQSMLGSVAREKALDKITSEQISEFEEILTEKIQQERIRGRDRYIKCDYGPPKILAEAAEEAGIESVRSAFPWKTGMWIETNRVLVSEGYNSDREEIYSTSEWPPAVDAVIADLEIAYTLSMHGYQAYGPFYMVEGAVKEFQGYDLTIRNIEDMIVHNTVQAERHNNAAVRVYARVKGALVFATADYYDKRRYDEYGDSPEQIALAAFEAHDHIDLNVFEVDARGLGSVSPLGDVESYYD